MKSSDFYTREKANVGIKVYLPTVDGKMTNEWVMLRHTESDAFRKKKADLSSKAMLLASMTDEKEKAKIIEDIEVECFSVLIYEWSLEDECTDENVKGLLKNTRYLFEYLDRKAMDSSLVFGVESGNVKSGLKDSADSTKRNTTQAGKVQELSGRTSKATSVKRVGSTRR